MLQVKLGLYFNVLREAESLKAAGCQLFKKYHAIFIQPGGYYRVHSPPLDVALNHCCIQSTFSHHVPDQCSKYRPIYYTFSLHIFQLTFCILFIYPCVLYTLSSSLIGCRGSLFGSCERRSNFPYPHVRFSYVQMFRLALLSSKLHYTSL